MYSSPLFRSLEGSCGNARVPVMEQHQLLSSATYHQVQHQLGEAVLDHRRSGPMLSPRSSSDITVANSAHPQLGGGFSQNNFPLEVSAPAAAGVDVRRHSVLGAHHVENWGDSGMGATSPFTETSTDVDTDEKNRLSGGALLEGAASVDFYDGSKEKNEDIKIVRRLTQNREAARRSRLRKKAYVQQLESSRLKLLQLEQELQRARQQGVFFSGGHNTEYGHSLGASGTIAFDLEYARWLEEQQKLMDELRSAVNSNASDNELRLHVDSVMAHYDDVFRLKNIAAKSDVFHMLSGMWVTPAERCFMWLGGFRSSELLKILAGHVEPLTDQQLVGICNLQQSSQQAEDALSQGMEALQMSLTDTLSSGFLHPSPSFDSVAGYMNLMANAMAKLGTLENFLRQADLLRQQTLQQMHRILTTRQAARALLAINDYFARLRALSSLWLARPRD